MEILLVVSPVDWKTEGYMPPPDAPVCYKVRLEHDDGEVLHDRLRCPFFAGARRLLERGIDPETPLAMRHRGATTITMRSTVGEAAKWTVRENKKTGPDIVPYVPFPEDNPYGE